MTPSLQSPRFLVAPLVVALGLLNLACGNLAGPHYQGEPMVTLRGQSHLV